MPKPYTPGRAAARMNELTHNRYGFNADGVRRWMDQGKFGRETLPRTPGGHRQLTEEAIVAFLKKNHYLGNGDGEEVHAS